MLLGSLTFLTVQSNLICYYYSFMRLLAPDGEIVRLLYPLAFALGVILTPLYYGLNHFVAEKIRLDGVWIKKGWVWIPLANHLEHAHALPLMLLDAAGSAHAATTNAEVRCSLRCKSGRSAQALLSDQYCKDVLVTYQSSTPTIVYSASRTCAMHTSQPRSLRRECLGCSRTLGAVLRVGPALPPEGSGPATAGRI